VFCFGGYPSLVLLTFVSGQFDRSAMLLLISQVMTHSILSHPDEIQHLFFCAVGNPELSSWNTAVEVKSQSTKTSKSSTTELIGSFISRPDRFINRNFEINKVQVMKF
jgi:hypothetical protein